MAENKAVEKPRAENKPAEKKSGTLFSNATPAVVEEIVGRTGMRERLLRLDAEF